MSTKTQAPTVLEEAQKLIYGDRRDAYGSVYESFQKIADGWSGIFGAKITAKQVALAMSMLKIYREANKAGRDNLVDLAGYAGLAAQLQEVELAGNDVSAS